MSLEVCQELKFICESERGLPVPIFSSLIVNRQFWNNYNSADIMVAYNYLSQLIQYHTKPKLRILLGHHRYHTFDQYW